MKISDVPRFTHDVTILTPADGGHTEENLKVTFNYLGVDEVDRFDLKTKKGTADFLRSVVHRLDGLTTEDGKPVDYSVELRDRLFNLQHVLQGISAHYFDAVSKVKAGN
jgi:hypothetical protein